MEFFLFFVLIRSEERILLLYAAFHFVLLSSFFNFHFELTKIFIKKKKPHFSSFFALRSVHFPRTASLLIMRLSTDTAKRQDDGRYMSIFNTLLSICFCSSQWEFECNWKTVSSCKQRICQNRDYFLLFCTAVNMKKDGNCLSTNE